MVEIIYCGFILSMVVLLILTKNKKTAQPLLLNDTVSEYNK